MAQRQSSAAYVRSLPSEWEMRARELAKLCDELLQKYEDAAIATLRPEDEDDLLEELADYREQIGGWMKRGKNVRTEVR